MVKLMTEYTPYGLVVIVRPIQNYKLCKRKKRVKYIYIYIYLSNKRHFYYKQIKL